MSVIEGRDYDGLTFDFVRVFRRRVLLLGPAPGPTYPLPRRRIAGRHRLRQQVPRTLGPWGQRKPVRRVPGPEGSAIIVVVVAVVVAARRGKR